MKDMRKIVRLHPSPRAQAYLAKKQAAIARGGNLESTWKNARKTKAFRELFAVLIRMAGRRERCMYCEDSRGTTIEHFWPKARYKERAFVWINLLLVCQGCQS